MIHHACITSFCQYHSTRVSAQLLDFVQSLFLRDNSGTMILTGNARQIYKFHSTRVYDHVLLSTKNCFAIHPGTIKFMTIHQTYEDFIVLNRKDLQSDPSRASQDQIVNFTLPGSMIMFLDSAQSLFLQDNSGKVKFTDAKIKHI